MRLQELNLRYSRIFSFHEMIHYEQNYTNILIPNDLNFGGFSIFFFTLDCSFFISCIKYGYITNQFEKGAWGLILILGNRHDTEALLTLFIHRKSE